MGCCGEGLGSHVRFACGGRDCADPMGLLSLRRTVVSPRAGGDGSDGIPTGVQCDVGWLRSNVNLLV